jgi:hypothetical protein
MAPLARMRPERYRDAHDVLGRWVMVHVRALRGRATLDRYR